MLTSTAPDTSSEADLGTFSVGSEFRSRPRCHACFCLAEGQRNSAGTEIALAVFDVHVGGEMLKGLM